MNLLNTMPQVIGIIAFLLFIYSVQEKGKKKLLAFQLIANFLYGLQYVLLLAVTAGYMNFISVIRCFVFYIYDEKKKKPSVWSLIAICMLIIITGILTYSSWLTMIPVVITLLYTISTWQDNMRIVRITFTFCSIIWIFFNLQVGAYSSVIGNVFELSSGILSLIRFNNK